MLGSIYADNLVVFLHPSAREFNCIQRILELFAGTSGLSTNLDKCMMTPIHCSQEDIQAVQLVFPCWIQDFRTKYLGAPLFLSRLGHADEQRIMDAVAARIPTWKGGLLTNTRRATLTQTTLSAIPIHVSICCNLSSWAINQIDKRRRAFLWTGTDSISGGRCRVAWPIVCSPKEHGGLGLLDLRVLGFALRLRWEWLRRTRPDAAWAQLPSRPERAIAAMFSVSVSVQVGDGTTAHFWTDSWLSDGAICHSAPNLYRAIGRRRLNCTVREMLHYHQWAWDIIGAPMAQVLCEYVLLWEKLEVIQLSPLESDRLIWKWSENGAYTALSAYRAYFTRMTALVGAKHLWKSAVPPKVNFFFWLALHGCLWTAERRMRHNLQQDAACVICDQHDETTDHLLASCVFVRKVWYRLLSRAGLEYLVPADDSRLADWW